MDLARPVRSREEQYFICGVVPVRKFHTTYGYLRQSRSINDWFYSMHDTIETIEGRTCVCAGKKMESRERFVWGLYLSSWKPSKSITISLNVQKWRVNRNSKFCNAFFWKYKISPLRVPFALLNLFPSRRVKQGWTRNEWPRCRITSKEHHNPSLFSFSRNHRKTNVARGHFLEFEDIGGFPRGRNETRAIRVAISAAFTPP